MDLQKFVEGLDTNASVFSFDRLPDGSFSELRIMGANNGFKAMFALNPMAPKYEPGLPARAFFHDPNFENFCYRCASEKKPLYSYVNAHGSWLTGMYLPVESDTEGTFNCCYILTISQELESEKMSKHSSEIANAVLDMNIKLNKEQDFVKAITGAVRDIKQICSSNLCSIVIVDNRTQACTFINENGENNEYMHQLASGMGRTPYEVAVAWNRDLAGSDCLLLDDLTVIKERDPEWYDSLNAWGINSIVLYSIKFNNELVGFIWAANFDVTSMMKIKETLELSTFFIGAVIANHQLLQRLEVMSMFDMLTGVSNRNAMNKRTDSLSGYKPNDLGIIITDLNGLKEVNDKFGHNAGDKLLQRAAAIVKKVFDDMEIYRAGGDEFVIICPDISKDELDRRVASLREEMNGTDDVSFAVGVGYFSGDYDIRKAMKIADENMYLDKQHYYAEHPEKKRK